MPGLEPDIDAGEQDPFGARAGKVLDDQGRAGRAVAGSRKVYFAGTGETEAALYDFETMASGVEHQGPAIIESPFTTVVADADTRFLRTASGSLVMRP